jgi:hypothetical protein
LWSKVFYSIYGFVVTSLLRLDREALPLTISFADGVLIRKPFAKGLTQSSSSWHISQIL